MDTFHFIYAVAYAASGGFVTACCPQSVVYAVKSLLRSESVRDHIDIIMSLKTQPTIVINDMPGMTALHGNKRKSGMFAPNGGRFAPATEENVKLCKAGKLEVDLPEMDVNSLQAHQQECFQEEHRHSTRDLHPVTQVVDTHCAVDRFHKANIKTDTEKLRDVDIVKQLRGNLNTQVEEQLFRQLGRDTYFLNMLTPNNYLFVLRLLLHLHNIGITDEQMRKATQAFQKCSPKVVAAIGPDCRLYMAKGEGMPLVMHTY